MEIFDFTEAWDYLKEGVVIKRTIWKEKEVIAMIQPDGSQKIYKLLPFSLTDEDEEATDWTFAEEQK